MLSINGLRNISIGMLLAFMAAGFEGLYHLFSKPLYATGWILVSTIFGALAIMIGMRWFNLESMRMRGIALLTPSNADPKYKKKIYNTLGHVLGRRVFRQGVINALDKPNVFQLYIENNRPMLRLDITFESRWDNHNYLRSALGWIAVAMPTTLYCPSVDRKGTRLIFTFTYADATRHDAQGLQDAVAVWKSNMGTLFYHHFYKCSIQILQKNPMATQLPQVAKKRRPPAPVGKFEHNVHLNQENVNLHIGFNGSHYYTYFKVDGQTGNPNGLREYNSWDELWSLWQHMDEVQTALTNPRILKSH